MRAVTLDTTVLVKGLVPPRRRKKDTIYDEQIRLHRMAGSMLTGVESGESTFHIPSLALVEVAAVVARLTGKAIHGRQAADYVAAHGLILRDKDLLKSAIDIGSQTKISGFDTLFITCAKLTKTVLVTGDKQMFDTAADYGIKAKLLRSMK